MSSDEISITRKDNIIELNGTGISVNFYPKDKEKTLNGILEKCKELDLLLPDDKYFKDVKHDLEIQLTHIYEEYQKENRGKKNKKDTDSNNSEKEVVIVAKRQYPSFKYSNKGKENLHEAVILSGEPVFLSYENGECKVFAQIEESNRIIKPPYPEEYPYEPYEFADMPDVLSYVDRAKKETMDSIFDKTKKIVCLFNDQDDYKLSLLAADIDWSYFQDRFSTTHYLAVIGDNGSGKSTVGDTFESIGYRAVNMTDPTAANLFRLLGTIEPGQCTIIADEAEKIDQSSDIMSILKTGYHIKKKVTKTNTNTWKVEHFWTYCFKMIIAERSPNQSTAKGVLDRAFHFNTYKGNPKMDIKEILNPQGNFERQKLYDELKDLRKLMLIYRLIHFKDPIEDIEIGIKGRDKELCKPLLQLFNNTKSQKEIEASLQKFLDAKNQRKENTIESALYPILVNLISQYGNEVSNAQIWQAIKDNIDGTSDERKPNEYYTSDFNIIYRNTITNMICDKFGAKRKHKANGNRLVFDPEKLAKVGKVYNSKIGIQSKIVLEDDAESNESNEGSIENASLSNDNFRNEHQIEMTNIENNMTRFNEKMTPDTYNSEEHITSNRYTHSPKPSQPSQPSAFIESGKNIHKDIIHDESSNVDNSSKPIYRLGHSDIFACSNCKNKGDKWYMKQHICRGSKHENE